MTAIDQRLADCKCGGEFFYFPAINEEGWRCCWCVERPGEPAGFDPWRDRQHIARKVGGLLNDLFHAKIVHVSNGSHGDAITSAVVAKCRKLERFDQSTIVQLLVEGLSSADYWKKISDGIVAGADPRERCSGGQLATMYKSGPSGSGRYCSKQGCPCGGGVEDEVPF